jgi:nucleotide-binding universal stress UspA family protein
MRSIIVGIDGSERDTPAVAFGCALAAVCDATPRLVTVLPRGADDVRLAALDRARELAATAVETEAVERASPARGLQDLAERRPTIAIVVGHTHHKGAGRFAGVPQRLLHDAHCAVAIVPSGASPGPELRRLTVAFDGSVEARGALAQALALASRTGGTVRIVGVIDRFWGGWAGPEGDPVHRELVESARADLRGGVDEVLGRTAGEPPVELELPEGEVLELVVEASRGSDLLVCGTRGSGTLVAAVLRRISSELAQSAACPVVAVPRGAPAMAPRRRTALSRRR